VGNRNTITRGRRPPGSMGAGDREKILAYLRNLAAKLDKGTLTCREVNADGHVNVSTIIRAFGGFSEAVIQAGLKPSRIYKRNSDTMLKELGELVTVLNRRPSKTEVTENLSYNARHYEKEFGSLEKACELARKRAQPSEGSEQAPPSSNLNVSLTRTTSRRRYGPIIDFPGLKHAPINEMGVVLLFGMLADDLGFVVESVQISFPDCDAKRRSRDGSFVGYRIEFEYKSSSFEAHGHNPDECDLIVCWEHDWKDCPLEVLELSEVVHKQSSGAS